MNIEALPLWLAWLVALVAIAGAALSLIGAIGLGRLTSFYDRVHAPTLGTTLGTMLMLTASIVFFSWIEQKLVLRDLLIGLFLTLTTPVTLILLVRASIHRDRSEGREDVPGQKDNFSG
jgi:multicomponent K+:H+ antiporter subunit G